MIRAGALTKKNNLNSSTFKVKDTSDIKSLALIWHQLHFYFFLKPHLRVYGKKID